MRAERLISIVLLLQVHRRLTARDLAGRLEVSERTILRDMDALSGSGIPVIAERGAGGGWRLMDDYQTRLTGLTPAEVQSLFLAKPSRLLADLGLERQAEAAFLKLQAALPAAARRQAEFARERIFIDSSGWRDPGESAVCLPVVLEALWRERKLRFQYARALGDVAERTADPFGVVAKGSTWYLVARVEGEVRTYRVSRMRDAEVLEEAGARPADFNLAAYWERSAAEFREKLPRYYATFRAAPAVMRWARYRGWRLEQQTADGEWVRFTMRFDIEEEAVQFGLSFGGDIEVIEPVEMRKKVLAGAAAILRRAGTLELPDSDPK